MCSSDLSTFTIHFPKKTDLKSVNFYYGRYGESKYAKDVITLKYDEQKNQIQGTLKKGNCGNEITS